jgi:hypothetical protein
LEIFDLLPKHEQIVSVDDFFLVSINCFIGDCTAGTIFDGSVGTSSSNDGGRDLESFGNVKIGSGEGN